MKFLLTDSLREYSKVGYKSKIDEQTNIMDADKVPLTATARERYRSIYRFRPQDLKNHNSLADLGDIKVYADYLILDLDDEANPQNSFKDAVKVASVLREFGAQYETWYSGHKGFHICIPTIQFGFEPTDDEGVLKRMAELLCKGNEPKPIVKTLDTSLYNKSRVVRCPLSRHAKTKLYKTGIVNILDTSLDQVQKLAREPGTDPFPPLSAGMKQCYYLKQIYEMAKVRQNRTFVAYEPTEGFSLFPSVQKGERNAALFKVSKRLARRGIPYEDAIKIGQWYNESLPEPDSNRKQIENTIRSAYKGGVNVLADEDTFHKNMLTTRQQLQRAYEHYGNLSSNIIKTGYPELDEFSLSFMRGDLLFWLARPGNLKTAFLSSLLQKTSQNMGQKAIYFSMDTSENRLVRRHIQYAEGIDSEDAMDGLYRQKPFPHYEKQFRNVICCYLSGLSINQILGMLDYYMEENGGKICAIGYDYLSLFDGCANDTEKTAKTAIELKTKIAKTSNALNVCLVQAKREYGDGDIEIDRQAGKDSSSIEDSGDFIFGSWWHEHKKSPYRWVRALKARDFQDKKYDEYQLFKMHVKPQHMKVDRFEPIKSSEAPDFKKVQRY